MTRRNFLGRIGVLFGALSVSLPIITHQERKVFEYTTPKTMRGFKGTQFLETGYVYAPYIPLYTMEKCGWSFKNLTSKRLMS